MAKEKTAKADIKKSDFEMKLKEFIENKDKEFSIGDGKTLFVLAIDGESLTVMGTIQGSLINVVTSLYGLMKTNVVMEQVIKSSVLTLLANEPHIVHEIKEAFENDIQYLTFKENESKNIDFSSMSSEEVKSDYLKEIEAFVKEFSQHVSDNEGNSVLLVAMDETYKTILSVVIGKVLVIYPFLLVTLKNSKEYEKTIMLTYGFYVKGPASFDKYGNPIS